MAVAYKKDQSQLFQLLTDTRGVCGKASAGSTLSFSGGPGERPQPQRKPIPPPRGARMRCPGGLSSDVCGEPLLLFLKSLFSCCFP